MRGRGPLSQESLEHLEKIWKRCVAGDLERIQRFFDKYATLVRLINSTPCICILWSDGPTMNVGSYQIRNLVKVIVGYRLPEPVPTVPEVVRHAFLNLVNEIDKICPVYATNIGFKHPKIPATDWYLPDDRANVEMHSRPFLEIDCDVGA